ncbi:hypothetical protein P9E08_08650 [Bacillus mojavensis]|uniref:hypothetical protein n=1 Tax=Bacillus mojavensis TaxID=72360 RepID=UPI002DB6BEA3|nr:hypothetical protein [Bacillus mojavensis]MEC1625448.1 hypothetical protein [Bacillus mojavensis]
MAVMDKIEVLRRKYRKQLAAVTLFEELKEQLDPLIQGIEELSKVSDSSIDFGEGEELKVLLTLEGKRAMISLKERSNEIIAKRLEENVAVEISLLVEEESELSVRTNVMPIHQRLNKEDSKPEILLDTILNELFFDVTQR